MLYTAMQFLTEGIKKAGSIDSDKVSAALKGMTVDSPIGKQTLRAKDQQANRSEYYGLMIKDPKGGPAAVMSGVSYPDPDKVMD